jgi:hypothetical protein
MSPPTVTLRVFPDLTLRPVKDQPQDVGAVEERHVLELIAPVATVLEGDEQTILVKLDGPAGDGVALDSGGVERVRASPRPSGPPPISDRVGSETSPAQASVRLCAGS